MIYRKLLAKSDPYLAPVVLANNAAGQVFASPTGIVWGTYGYYKDQLPWNSKASDVIIPDIETNRVNKISAIVYGYYNSPSNCLGTNYLTVHFSDASVKYIGSFDGNSAGASGQSIYRGDLSTLGGANDATGQVYSATASAGEYVTLVEFFSSYYSGYSAAYRGLQSITVEYYN